MLLIILTTVMIMSTKVESASSSSSLLFGIGHYPNERRLSLHQKLKQQPLSFLKCATLPRGGSENQGEESTTESSAPTHTTDTQQDIDDDDKEENEEKSTIVVDIDNNNSNNKNYNFSVVQYGDGSESDPDGIPRRFLKMQRDNRPKALEALQHTLEWRRQHDVDTILQRPHSKFDICKVVCPHYFAGHDPYNHSIIFVQRVGLTNVTLGHLNNLTEEELLFHYVYILEYCWNILEVDTMDQTMLNVIDMTGVNLEMLRDTERMSFMKKFVSIMSHNYPSRSYKTLLINTPRWFGLIYKLVTPLLRESTKQKIEIHSKGKKQNEALENYLGHGNVPKELIYNEDNNNNNDKKRNRQKKKRQGDNQDHDGDSDGEDTMMENENVGLNSLLEQHLRYFCVTQTEAAGVSMQVPLYV